MNHKSTMKQVESKMTYKSIIIKESNCNQLELQMKYTPSRNNIPIEKTSNRKRKMIKNQTKINYNNNPNINQLET